MLLIFTPTGSNNDIRRNELCVEKSNEDETKCNAGKNCHCSDDDTVSPSLLQNINVECIVTRKYQVTWDFTQISNIL